MFGGCIEYRNIIDILVLKVHYTAVSVIQWMVVLAVRGTSGICAAVGTECSEVSRLRQYGAVRPP